VTAPGFVALGLLAAWMATSWALFSADNDYATRKLCMVPLLMLPPVLGSQELDPAAVRRLLKAMVVVGAASTCIGLRALMTGEPGEVLRAATSSTANPLWFGYSISASILSALCLAWHGSRFGRLTVLGFLLPALSLVLASGSRGPLLALAVAVLSLWVTRGRGRRFYLLAVVVIIATCMPVLVRLAPEFALERITSAIRFVIGREGDAGIISSGRTLIWQTSLEAWRYTPILGVGLGNYEDPGGKFSFSHNLFLELLVELGLLGIGLFTVYLAAVARASRIVVADRSEAATAAVAMLSFALVQISLSGQVQADSLFWFSSGLAISLARVSRKRPPRCALHKGDHAVMRRAPMANVETAVA